MDAGHILREMLHTYNVNYGGALDDREAAALRAALTPWITWMARPPFNPLRDDQMIPRTDPADLRVTVEATYLGKIRANEKARAERREVPYPDDPVPGCGRWPCRTCESLRARVVAGEFGNCTYASLRPEWCMAHGMCTAAPKCERGHESPACIAKHAGLREWR